MVGSVLLDAAPASAETPTVTVTPSTVHDGGTVTITTSGFPSGVHAFFECPASFPGSGSTSPFPNCARLSDIATDSVPPPTFDATVHAVFTTADGSRTVDCAIEPGGCVVGVFLVSVDPTPTQAWAPISFFPGLVAQPSRGLGDGHTVTLTGEGLPDGERSIAQCTRDHAETQDPGQADTLCGPATGVTVVDGAFSVDLGVHEPLVAVDGSTHPCSYRGCVLVMSSPATPVETVAGLSFGPPSLTIDTPPAPDDQFVALTLAGLPGQQAVVYQCAEPVVLDRCDAGTDVTLDSLGSWTGERVVSTAVQSTGGFVYSCFDEQCVLVAFVDEVPLASAPLDFAPGFGITLYPSGALLDGQPIDVEVTGLPPDSTHTLLQCATSCDELGTYTASPEGTLDVTVTVSQRVGQTAYCRDNCRIGMEFEGQLRTVGFTMAPGEFTVTPNDGLADAQPVAVSGTDLMPTYTGPTLGPFPTGGWALAQCDTTMGNQPDLYDAFDHCTVLPTPNPVTITGSTYDETTTAQATITTILGRTVDCDASPGACVIALLRFEQDASVSTHLAPITFTGT